MTTLLTVIALVLGLALGFVLGRRYGRREMFVAYQARFDAVTGKAAIIEALLMRGAEEGGTE